MPRGKKNCPYCGSEISSFAKICPFCGAPAGKSEEPEKPTKTQEKQQAEQPSAKPAPKPTAKTAEKKPAEKKPAEKKHAKPNLKDTKKSKGGGTKFVAILLVIALLFTSFVKPGFFRPKPKPPVDYSMTYQPKPPADTSKPQKDDFDPETLLIPEGNSKAINSTPCQGFTVTAPQNAFLQDTEITIKPVTENTVAPQPVLQAAQEIEDTGAILLGAHEVHAGLADDELMPGEYTVKVDLDTFGIDPVLYEHLRVYRVADDGSWYEYAADIDNNTLTFASDQNCYWFWAIFLSISGLIAYKQVEAEANESVKYFYDTKKKKFSYRGKSRYAPYTIYWAMEDIGVDADAIEAQLKDLFQEYEAKKDELYRVYEENRQNEASLLDHWFKRGKSASDVLAEAIREDKRFQELDKQLKLPEPIEYTALCADRAFEFLKDHEYVKLPTGMVDLVSVTTLDPSELAVETSRKMHEGYVELNIPALVNADKVTKNDFLVTITHELLHVCQQKYRFFFADSIRYDEMAAVKMEDRALSYFIGKGWIESDAVPPLSSTDYWSTLKLPIDKWVDDDEKTKYMRHEGYNLGLFLKYLGEKTGELLWTGRVMRERSSVRKSDTTGALRKLFSISPEELDVHYRNFIRAYKTKLDDAYNHPNTDDDYKRNPEVPLEPGQKAHASVTPEGSFASEVRGFRQTKISDQKLVVVYDPGFSEEQPGCDLVPIDRYERIPKGLFIYPKEDIKNSLNRNILEIHGLISDSEMTSSAGYTVYMLAKTGPVTVSEDADNVVLKMPKSSLAAADGAVDGYYLTITGDNGYEFKQVLKREYFEQEYRIKKSDISEEEDTQVNLTITLCEYVQKDEKTVLLGDASDPVSYKLVLKSASDLAAFNGVWIPMEYQGKVKSSDWCTVLAYIPEEKEIGIFEGRLDQRTLEKRWTEIKDFEYDEKTGELFIDFTKGSSPLYAGYCSYRITENNTLILTNSNGSEEFFRAN